MRKFIVALIYLWLGLLGGIAFLETPLKFHAEGVTREIGLAIGSLVFSTLNKVELLLAIGVFVMLIICKPKKNYHYLFSLLPLLILILEGFYLYPILSERAVMIIKGIEPEKAPYHIYSIAFIFVKFISLNILGVIQLKKLK